MICRAAFRIPVQYVYWNSAGDDPAAGPTADP
jgi:hypothetical protein